MDDGITTNEQLRAIERWENEGGKVSRGVSINAKQPDGNYHERRTSPAGSNRPSLSTTSYKIPVAISSLSFIFNDLETASWRTFTVAPLLDLCPDNFGQKCFGESANFWMLSDRCG